MKIDVVLTGIIQENCYIVSDENKAAAVIDPGDNAKEIIKFLDKNGLKAEWILITHGHYDHIGAVAAVKEYTGAKIAIHEDDKEALRFEPDMLAAEGDIIQCGLLKFGVIETPGHTPGCVCYVCGGAMFSGDTLFRESIGRTDLPGGSFYAMRKSLHKLSELPYEDIDVYPGHMEATTLRHERKCNPFFDV